MQYRQSSTSEMENIYEAGYREQQKAMQIYTQEKAPPRSKTGFIKNLLPKSKSSRNRRHSFTVGDYEHEPYRPSSNFPQQYRTESPYPRPDYYDSTGSSPIYDDISLHRPNRFTLSNYGHLQIDYSCNWNNLNKYIYN